MLELFSGRGALSRCFKRRGCRAVSVELYNELGLANPSADLSVRSNIDRLIKDIESGAFKYVHLGTPCSSFSVLQTLFNHGTRSRNRPQGDGTRSNELHGNLLLKHSILVIRACMRHNVFWTLENPKSSYLFWMPSVRAGLARRVPR